MDPRLNGASSVTNHNDVTDVEAFLFSPQPPALPPEKAMAGSMLRQAAYDLRRFRGGTSGVERQLYLDAVRLGRRRRLFLAVLFREHLPIPQPPAGRRPWGTLRRRVDGLLRLLDAAVPTRRSLIPKFSKPGFQKKPQLKPGRSSSSYSRSTYMKTPSHGFAQKLRRILRSVVRESNDRHNPLLINSLAAFNFRLPLEFPGEKLARSGAFSR